MRACAVYGNYPSTHAYTLTQYERGVAPEMAVSSEDLEAFTLDCLPFDCIVSICEYLSAEDLARMSRVCSVINFLHVLSSERLICHRSMDMHSLGYPDPHAREGLGTRD